MRVTFSIIAIVFGATSIVFASPITSTQVSRRYPDGVGSSVAAVGQCPTDCWNEAVVQADCDPNIDDDCLCGPFFDAVTDCTSEACNTGDNLAALSFLQPVCV
ncbi:hypothetical protein T440DRAFT_471373 [Plenodomus tracheiphilus IPT5]|uniref:CFEM domain-containing protein n=1 Tax=Plenodomus tracheiphilus IPT5 TaxID=1408161 RepID=A0A6A7AYA0_9PLEO|nr:hypothetical protein T440DRAFT_471373 [Plenodomus tracheiphilus IPT5]